MGVPGPDGKDVELAAGQVVELRNGLMGTITSIDRSETRFPFQIHIGPSADFEELAFTSEGGLYLGDKEDGFDIVRVIGQRETVNDDGTVTKICTLPVTQPAEVWAEYNPVAVRTTDRGDVFANLLGRPANRYGTGEYTRLILERKTPTIDPDVLTFVEACELGDCEIHELSRAVAIDRLRDSDRVRVIVEAKSDGIVVGWDPWMSSYLGPFPLPDDWVGRIDLAEVRRLIAERQGVSAG